MWTFPGPGIKPMSPALAGIFLTTGPPRKSEHCNLDVAYIDELICVKTESLQHVPTCFLCILWAGILCAAPFLSFPHPSKQYTCTRPLLHIAQYQASLNFHLPVGANHFLNLFHRCLAQSGRSLRSHVPLRKYY